jgi:D-amino peptidase
MKKLALAAVILVATGAAGQEPKPRVYVSVDMEGISGVVHADQTSADSRDYQVARKWMADDVNAVVAGLVAAGAGEIVVNDSHGGMRNLLPDDLRPEVTLISGTPKPLSMMAGIDGSFAACLFVGYHAEAGSAPAVLDHTISSGTVYSVKVNGVEMPELGLNAAVAGHFGVPVVMLSGDTTVCEQGRTLLGAEPVTVPVKEALGRTAAKLVALPEARRRLEDSAREALARRSRVTPFRLTPPLRFEVAFLSSGQAEPGELIPGVERADARTLRFTARDTLEGVRLLRALIGLAAAR